MNDQPQSEMPKYRCHKEVWALKIKDLVRVAGHEELQVVPEDAGYGMFSISDEYCNKHSPEIGGYFVIYADGYKSFSPAGAFEDGYSLIK